ncbi:MAG TPA: YceI family protein [Gemmatimonadales bacterium]|jgi:polyisoprenoid-binding protein YceI
MTIEHWEIASSSRINFTVRHLLISKVHGRFSRWSGTVLVPDGDWSRATVEVLIDASSIDTGIAKRDADLRSANFLDVERYPAITFRSLRLIPGQADSLRIVGPLTMKGRVRQVTLEAKRSERARFSASAAIRRRDFGASGNVGWDKYGIMIGERIDIEIEVEAVRPVAAISSLSDIQDLMVTRA